jgi:hypothetical protein
MLKLNDRVRLKSLNEVGFVVRIVPGNLVLVRLHPMRFGQDVVVSASDVELI